MEDIILRAEQETGLADEAIEAALKKSLKGRQLKKVLIIPPDFTRYHSNAGLITQICYRLLTQRGIEVDILPALGTHAPVSRSQWENMYAGIPYEAMIIHDWRHDVIRLGEVPAEYLTQITDGIWKDPVSVEINHYG